MRLHAFLLLALVLASCAENENFHRVASARDISAPPELQLTHNKSLGTLHFPAGTYVAYAADDTGWYYRAPRKVIQHSWGESVPYDGGLFVDKRDPNKTRGYIVWAAGLTKLGTIRGVNAPPPPAAEEPLAPAEGPEQF
jgi:hypothetical protein